MQILFFFAASRSRLHLLYVNPGIGPSKLFRLRTFMRYLSHALPNRRYGEQHFGGINQTPDVTASNPVIAQGGPRNMNYTVKFIF